MRISYRQGLISAQTNFLQTNLVSGNVYVDIVVSPTPVIASIAFRDRDYLVDETVSVPNAWGPFSDTQTYYLFWEILPDGNLSRGSTLFSLVSSTNPPTEQIGQMWWDNAVKVMKVFDGINWVPTLRVLAGSLHGGNVIPASYGSQVGLNVPTDAGYILRDAFQNVFRDNNGNFLTSTSPLTSSDTGSLVKFDGTQLTAQANEPIPKFSLVYLRDGRAALASGIPPDNIPKAPLGMVTEDAPQNAVVTIVTAGKTVFNEQWDFAISDLGKAVFCGPNGEVTPQKPLSQKNMRVGTIITKQSLLLNFDWETEASIVTSGVTGVMASAPLSITGTLSTPMVNIQRATSNLDGFMNASDFARIPALELLVAGKSDIGHLHTIVNVTGLQGALDGKASISHTQDIASIIDLQITLDNKAPLIHSHNLVDILGWPNAKLEIDTNIANKIPKVMVGAGNFPMIVAGGTLTDSGFNDVSFALVSHTHVIIDVTDLPAALLLKSDVGHHHAIADVDGLVDELAGKALAIHSHIITDVAGLQSALDNKSNLGHTHVFADIPGLQITLNNKADTIHVHTITDVTGLQTALDNKSNLGHTHVISDVTGLQLALNSKADVSHSQLASSITDFYTTVANTLVAGSNITLTPDVIAKTITVAASGGSPTLLASEIAFGSSMNSLTSSSNFMYDDSNFTLSIFNNGNINFRVDSNGDLIFKETTAASLLANSPILGSLDTTFYGGNGWSNPSYWGDSSGGGFRLLAGRPGNSPAAVTKKGGDIILTAGPNFIGTSASSFINITGSGIQVEGPDISGDIQIETGDISYYDMSVYPTIHNTNRYSGSITIKTGNINSGSLFPSEVIAGDINIIAGVSDDGIPAKNGRVILGAGGTDGLTIGASGELELVNTDTSPGALYTTPGTAGQVITSRGPALTAVWGDIPTIPAPDVWALYESGLAFDAQSTVTPATLYGASLLGNRVYTLQKPPLVKYWRADEIAAAITAGTVVPWTANTGGLEFFTGGVYKLSIQSQFSIPALADPSSTQPYFPDNCQISYGTFISNINAHLGHNTILESVHYRYGPTNVDVNSNGYKMISWHDEFIVLVGSPGGITVRAYTDTNGGALAFYGDGTGTNGIKQYTAPVLLDSRMMVTVEKLPGQLYI